MSKGLRLFCGAVCLAATVGGAVALEPSGTTIAVVPSAAASGASGRRILEVKGNVFMGDRVQTGAAGEAQIEFRDNTRLVVGPNSLMTIDSFVFDDSNTAKKISMNALKGAFRFITGVSRKQAYSIHTPTTTIGIRGTRFDFAVGGNGETSFALFEGQARLCNRGGSCIDVRGSCAVVVVSPRGELIPVRAGPERSARLQALFPFVVSQARLRPGFRVDTSSCRIRHRPQVPELVPPVIRHAALPASPRARAARPDDPEQPGPEPTPRRGNPGNDKPVGNSGNKHGGDGERGNSGGNKPGNGNNGHGNGPKN